MKKAKEYLMDWAAHRSTSTIDMKLLEHILERVQKDTIEHTLTVAAKEAEVRIEYDSVRKGESNGYSDDNIWIRDQDGSGCNLYVNKNSILSLKDELFKEFLKQRNED